MGTVDDATRAPFKPYGRTTEPSAAVVRPSAVCPIVELAPTANRIAATETAPIRDA